VQGEVIPITIIGKNPHESISNVKLNSGKWGHTDTRRRGSTYIRTFIRRKYFLGIETTIKESK